MRVKISSFIKLLVVLLMLMSLSYFKLLGNVIEIFSTSFNSKQLALLYLGLLIICVLLSLTYYGDKTTNTYILETILILIGTFAAWMKEEDLTEGIVDGMYYLFFLLSYPIFVLLKRNIWTLEILTKKILILTLGSYAIRAYISLIHHLSGTVILSNIALESTSENWIRNGILRINPPCFSLIALPLGYYLAEYGSNRVNKRLGKFTIVTSLAYTVFVHQSRSLLIYQILTFIIMYCFQKVSDKKKLSRVVFVIILIVAVINTKFFENLVNSFSVSSAMGGSTIARSNALIYFGNLYLQKPLFGLGFISGSTPIGGHITDIGVMGSIFKLGIPILLFYILMFSHGIYVSLMARKYDNSESILVLGMTLLIMMTGINIDCFFPAFFLSVPFYIAIVQYVLYDKNRMR